MEAALGRTPEPRPEPKRVRQPDLFDEAERAVAERLRGLSEADLAPEAAARVLQELRKLV
jgi:hypothetical protein